MTLPVLPPMALTPPVEDRTPPLPGMKPGPLAEETQPFVPRAIPEPSAAARAIADMDDAGLTGLADTTLDNDPSGSVFDGWPEGHEFTAEKAKANSACQHAKDTLIRLDIVEEDLREQLASWEERLRAMGPKLNEAVDNLVGSFGGAAATAVAAPSQGLKGLADVPVAILNIGDSKRKQDIIVDEIMRIRGMIDDTLQELQQNNKKKVIVHDKKKALNCPR